MYFSNRLIKQRPQFSNIGFSEFEASFQFLKVSHVELLFMKSKIGSTGGWSIFQWNKIMTLTKIINLMTTNAIRTSARAQANYNAGIRNEYINITK